MTFTSKAGGVCGIYLQNTDEGHGKLTLFFEKEASEETRFHFEDYVHAHLSRRAIPNSLRRQRLFVCQQCGEPLTQSQVMHRKERGFSKIACGVCEAQISLLDREERLSRGSSLVPEMDQAANSQREREAVASVRQGLQDSVERTFDVFLCYNSEDKLVVKSIGKKLQERGIRPWLDEWELRPGFPRQSLLQIQIEQAKSAAVFVGAAGIQPWQKMELEAFLREFVEKGKPVIPVLLENAPEKPQLPPFLRGMTWVDFRRRDPDPLEQMIWGITGKQSVY
jgi:TIR domain